MMNQDTIEHRALRHGLARILLGTGLVLTPSSCSDDALSRGPDQEPYSGTNAQGGPGDDTLIGGDADDLLSGAGGSDRLFGAEGADELYGEAQGDMLQGGGGDDLLVGGEGPDLLNGGPGDDELQGGSGDDYYVVEAGHGIDAVDDTGGSLDRLTFAGISPDQAVSVREGDDLVITVPGGRVRIVDHYGAGTIELIDYERGQDPFAELDYGLYWFGPGDDSAKYVPTVANPYFDPSRPTIVLTHGWQPFSISNRRREGFNYESTGGLDIDLADAWIDAGWNIGMLYWQNFADELDVKNAEAKLWSPDGRGNRGMRWVNEDWEYQDWPFEFSVGDLALGSVTAAMLEANAPTVRLAGHSLGNQLATQVGARLLQAANTGQTSARLVPERVSLLDPFWTRGAKAYLGDISPGSRTRSLVQELLDGGVAVDAYRSSPLTTWFLTGDANPELFEKVCLVDLRPTYTWKIQLATKHLVGLWHYFLGFQYPENRDDQGLPVATAAAPVELLWECIDGGHDWKQVGGRNSRTPEDDTYERLGPS